MASCERWQPPAPSCAGWSCALRSCPMQARHPAVAGRQGRHAAQHVPVAQAWKSPSLRCTVLEGQGLRRAKARRRGRCAARLRGLGGAAAAALRGPARRRARRGADRAPAPGAPGRAVPRGRRGAPQRRWHGVAVVPVRPPCTVGGSHGRAGSQSLLSACPCLCRPAAPPRWFLERQCHTVPHGGEPASVEAGTEGKGLRTFMQGADCIDLAQVLQMLALAVPGATLGCAMWSCAAA